MVFGFGIIVLAALIIDAGITGRGIGEVIRGEIGRGFAFANIQFPGTQFISTPASVTGGTDGTGSGSGIGAIQGGGGIGTFDGKKVAGVLIPLLTFARHSGVWHGTVTSGYRTPAYSRSLCEARCGAPSCPGTCAGESSNHSGLTAERCAVDVSDPEGFKRALALPNCPPPHIFNNLPNDLVHFSPTGG